MSFLKIHFSQSVSVQLSLHKACFVQNRELWFQVLESNMLIFAEAAAGIRSQVVKAAVYLM